MRQISEKNTSFFFDPAIPPALTVESGETVTFMTKDCYDGQIDIDHKDFCLLDMSRNNPATGPLYIKGAEPGDTLKVEVLDIVPNEYGMMCVRLGKGVYHVSGNHCRIFKIQDGTIQFDQGIRIPVRPMIGVIGTCPATACDTHSPGPHGGNLDIRDLGIGSTVYLPVSVPGAMLSIGDCHALQGDGETAICGLEVSAAVTVRVTIVKEQLLGPVFGPGERRCFSKDASIPDVIFLSLRRSGGNASVSCGRFENQSDCESAQRLHYALPESLSAALVRGFAK